MLREELQLLQEPGSYVGEVIKVHCDPALNFLKLAPIDPTCQGTVVTIYTSPAGIGDG